MTTPSPLTVRQLGPTFARGLARHTRETIEAPARHLFDDALRAVRNRLGIRLRRAEARRVAARLLAEARRLAIGLVVRKDSFSFGATLPYVEDGGVRIGRFCFVSCACGDDGGYGLNMRVDDLVHLSRHALERMHLRVSSARWEDLAPETVTLGCMDGVAKAARAAGLRRMWLPTPSGGAFIVAFDAATPVVVSYLDKLSAARRRLIAPVARWYQEPGGDVGSLARILARSEFDCWRHAAASGPHAAAPRHS